jgi:8-oxo-dGTP diphosphatase
VASTSRGVGTLALVIAGVQRVLLQVWRRVPRIVRRWFVRLMAPSFTVGAAAVIERGDGSILLVRLVYRDGWGLPGGLIKRWEDVDQCARREVREEVGLRIDLVGAPAVVVDSRPQRIDVIYRARLSSGQDPADVPATSVEIREARWFPADELPQLQHEAVTALIALGSSATGGAATTDPGSREAGDEARGTAPNGPGDVIRLAAAEAAAQRAERRRALTG